MDGRRATPQVARRPGLQTRVDLVTHPSLCMGNPYSQDMRRLVMFIEDYSLLFQYNFRCYMGPSFGG